MRHLRMIIAALLTTLLAAACAEELPDIDFSRIYPALMIGEPFPEEAADALGRPRLSGAGTYSVRITNSDEEALSVELNYYAGAQRVVSVAVYWLAEPAAYDECGQYPVAGGTRLSQLEDMEGVEALEIEERDEGSGFARFRFKGMDCEAGYGETGGEKVINTLKILNTPAELERMTGNAGSGLTIADMNSAALLETTMDELAARFPDYHFEDHTGEGRPYVSMTYTLSDCSHFTYLLVERDGKYRVESMFWVPESGRQLRAEPEEYNVSRRTCIEDFGLLRIGETTYAEIAQQYMDMYGMEASQRPEIVIANKDGEYAALYFGRRDTRDDNSVLYAIQHFTDNRWLNGVLMNLPSGVR